jgi:hypothetical protein
MQQWPTLNRLNMHETYIYHPFSTHFNAQIQQKITSTTPQILTSLNLSALGINRVNNKSI